MLYKRNILRKFFYRFFRHKYGMLTYCSFNEPRSFLSCCFSLLSIKLLIKIENLQYFNAMYIYRDGVSKPVRSQYIIFLFICFIYTFCMHNVIHYYYVNDFSNRACSTYENIVK